jgi:hypothetical protein
MRKRRMKSTDIKYFKWHRRLSHTSSSLYHIFISEGSSSKHFTSGFHYSTKWRHCTFLLIPHVSTKHDGLISKGRNAQEEWTFLSLKIRASYPETSDTSHEVMHQYMPEKRKFQLRHRESVKPSILFSFHPEGLCVMLRLGMCRQSQIRVFIIPETKNQPYPLTAYSGGFCSFVQSVKYRSQVTRR